MEDGTYRLPMAPLKHSSFWYVVVDDIVAFVVVVFVRVGTTLSDR